METTTRKRIIAGLAAIAMCGAMVPSAMAANSGTVEGSPTDSAKDQKLTTTTSETSTSGNITLKVTSDKWTDPGGDTHDKGTYQVVIPTSITWSGLSVGTAVTATDTATTYSATVRGWIDDGKTVEVTVADGDGHKLTNDNDTTGFTPTYTRGSSTVTGVTRDSSNDHVNVWNATAVNKLNTSTGKTSGTAVTDEQVGIAGTPKNTSDYNGTLAYSAELKSAS